MILFNALLWHFLFIWLCKVEYWNKTDPLLFSIVESLVHFHHLHRYGSRQTVSSLRYKVKSHSSLTQSPLKCCICSVDQKLLLLLKNVTIKLLILIKIMTQEFQACDFLDNLCTAASITVTYADRFFICYVKIKIDFYLSEIKTLSAAQCKVIFLLKIPDHSEGSLTSEN